MTDSLHERIAAAIGGQYRIEHEIGRGGMSVVYRAHDLRLNRAVAVKVLPPDLAHDPAVVSRFTREAQTSAQLSHPHIVPIHDVGERDGMAYFVMPLITGGNLAARLEAHPLRAVDEVRRVLAEVADALAYAHLRGVIHRDVKADNILIDAESGRAMVTDFGIARAMEGGARLTQTGIAVGTPTYMSPEQAVGERDIDGRSDIYSLGVLGYQMLTGRVPFTAGNSMALLLKHVSERPRPILELRPEAPKELADAVERALAKSPDSRWPTAAAFRDALSAEGGVAALRSELRERVRYASPVPRSGRRDLSTYVSPRSGSRAVAAPTSEPRALVPEQIELVPPHLAALTSDQQTDLRLWDGRVHLLDRVKAMRRYTLMTAVMVVLGVTAFVVGVEDVPPLVLGPIVPIYMGMRLRRRGRSLRESGLRLHRIFLALRSRNVLARALGRHTRGNLAKLVASGILDGSHGAIVRRAAEDRAAIREIVGSLSKPDRALLPDIGSTVDALFERVVRLVETLRPLDADVDPALVAELDARLAALGATFDSPDEERRVALLRRQRETLEGLSKRRAMLVRQLESAGLALSNLRLELIQLRAAGVDSAVRDVSTATQDARALSQAIGVALDVAAEVREM
jgi:serine/threonine-protein kinase